MNAAEQGGVFSEKFDINFDINCLQKLQKISNDCKNSLRF